ncbi:MAG: glycosyltransferase family 2 protein [Hahellaceae bacterium]|nr:glycosyltransferase family 2 protein [Hahellaceae bacterium]
MIERQIVSEKISIVIPAKNEARSLEKLLPEIVRRYPEAEVIVVNDGSTDDTIEVCKASGVRVITHNYSKGNGAAVKTGARAAAGEILVLMDGDGQHRPDEIAKLLAKYHEGYHLVVGARARVSQASKGRWVANSLYNTLASWMVGHTVDDLTSGFRVVNLSKFREFLSLLPNGFSYPTTSTMAFFRAGYSVGYEPITVEKRLGKSHIRLLKDGTRFLLIIFKIGTLYSPLKIFFPLSMLFASVGLGYYGFTYLTDGRFTNMSALLLSTSVVIFLIGLVSEQVTSLLYRND